LLLIDGGRILRGQENGVKKLFTTSVEFYSVNWINRYPGSECGEAIADLPPNKQQALSPMAPSICLMER